MNPVSGPSSDAIIQKVERERSAASKTFYGRIVGTMIGVLLAHVILWIVDHGPQNHMIAPPQDFCVLGGGACEMEARACDSKSEGVTLYYSDVGDGQRQRDVCVNDHGYFHWVTIEPQATSLPSFPWSHRSWSCDEDGMITIAPDAPLINVDAPDGCTVLLSETRVFEGARVTIRVSGGPVIVPSIENTHRVTAPLRQESINGKPIPPSAVLMHRDEYTVVYTDGEFVGQEFCEEREGRTHCVQLR